jgi:hypothetical protein
LFELDEPRPAQREQLGQQLGPLGGATDTVEAHRGMTRQAGQRNGQELEMQVLA